MPARPSRRRPAPGDDLGLAERVLAANVARRFFVDGATKSDIAEELGMSRFKVARLLDQAREVGLVRIEIDYRGDVDLDRTLALGAAYDLRQCVVIGRPEGDDASLRADLGRAAAGVLEESVVDEDVLGVVWARSVIAIRPFLRRLARCAVVQLTGALAPRGTEESAVELVRDIARVSGGPAYFFYAPMIVSDVSAARTLRSQPEIAHALNKAHEVTKAVVGIGAWRPGGSTVADAISDQERRDLRELGVRAEVGGIQLDAEGRPLRTPLTDRLIGIGAEQLEAVPEVIAIAYGEAKADAVRATLRGGLVTGLVTHASLADALLERA
jgi:DNA-binding transcriptional regulator LsrR (DeoR family)